MHYIIPKAIYKPLLPACRIHEHQPITAASRTFYRAVHEQCSDVPFGLPTGRLVAQAVAGSVEGFLLLLRLCKATGGDEDFRAGGMEKGDNDGE
jgi:hypothetical protein